MEGGLEEELQAKVSGGEAGSGQGGRQLVEILCLSGSGGGQGGDFKRLPPRTRRVAIASKQWGS